MKINKEAKFQQRLEWIMFKLRMDGFDAEFINAEIELIKANKFSDLDAVTTNVIVNLGIQSEFKKLTKW